MEYLIKKIEQWAEDRNIIKGTKPIDQAMKLFSEFGELADNVGKGRDCRDDIGDVFVVLTIMCKQHGRSIFSYLKNPDLPSMNKLSLKEYVIHLCNYLHSFSYMGFDNSHFSINMCIELLKRISEINKTTLEECVKIAYNDIKDRKGIVSNGVFIKESDPVYDQVIAEIEGNYNV